MLRLRHLTALTLFGTTFVLQGCFNSDSSPVAGSDDPASDEAGIQAVIFEEQVDLADPDVRWYDDDAEAPAGAPINTHGWRRELLSVDKVVSITIEKPDEGIPTAEVVVEAKADGLLHLWACEEDELLHLTKDFADSGTRKLFFQRSRRLDTFDAQRHRGWKLAALSGVKIESPGTTRSIESVRVQAGDLDETITSVSELVRVGQLLHLRPSSEVLLTVTTGDATDSVFLHRRHARIRSELENNGDGTFSGRYMTGERVGPRHIVIDVLSESTLFDDEGAYDNVAWGIPYRVGGALDGIDD